MMVDEIELDWLVELSKTHPFLFDYIMAADETMKDREGGPFTLSEILKICDICLNNSKKGD